MVRDSQPLPTDAELALLTLLWERGALSVREVHEAMGRDVAYTSVLKQLQVLHAKGLVSRAEEGRAHIYRPAQEREVVEARAVRQLAARLFGGSAEKLAMRALSLRPTSDSELRRLKKLLGDEEERSG